MLILGILIGIVGTIGVCSGIYLYDKYNRNRVTSMMQHSYNRGLEVGRKESKNKEDEA